MSNLRLLLPIIFLLLTDTVLSQQDGDWPSTLNYIQDNEKRIMEQGCVGGAMKHREVVSEVFGKEYYCSGNVHAEGSIVLLNTQSYIDTNNKGGITKEYGRVGHWKVYFDTSIQILRSQGEYRKGKMDGHWTIYSITGQPKYEYEFADGIVKQKIEIDNEGKRQTIVSLSDGDIFVIKYKTLLILLAVIPITLFRIGFNILTYNKIHNTKYIPMLQNWQKGGYMANFSSTFIFWWMSRNNDSETVKRYKKIANIISLISIACFVGVMTLFMIFGTPD